MSTEVLERPSAQNPEIAEHTGGVWAGDVREWVREAAESTPFVPENYLLGRGNRLWRKCDHKQPTGSFKQRGAAVLVRHLYEAEGLEKVITASAGNHAQGVVMAAERLGIPSAVYVPKDTPGKKLDGIAWHSAGKAEINYYDDFEAANKAAVVDARLHPEASFIPPYNNEHVMAGQGTVGLEILEQAEAAGFTPNKIFVPAGGGGLLAGVAEAVKRSNPGVQVIGVQMRGNDSVYNSFHAGEIVPSSKPSKLCDGTAVQEMGELCFEKIKQHVDDVILIDPADLGEAYAHELRRMDELAVHYGDSAYDDLREPAGMLAETGAAVHARLRPECVNETWASIASGGNYDVERINALLEAHTQRKRQLSQAGLGRTAVLSGPTKDIPRINNLQR